MCVQVALFTSIFSLTPISVIFAWCVFVQNRYECHEITWLLFVATAPFEALRRGLVLLIRSTTYVRPDCLGPPSTGWAKSGGKKESYEYQYQPTKLAKYMMGTALVGYFVLIGSVGLVQSRDDDLLGGAAAGSPCLCMFRCSAPCPHTESWLQHVSRR